MPTLASFSLPAFIQDFPQGSTEDVALKARWTLNVEGWIQQAMPASPSFFYDPSRTAIPSAAAAAPVTWNAFPGRLDQYYSASPPVSPSNPYNLSAEHLYALADTGYYTDAQGTRQTFQPIAKSPPCPQADWGGTLQTFGPYGPRGWLDEYCEWSAARDANGNLLRVDFACENPEYWNTLWKVSPERVRELYESTLNAGAPAERQVTVQLEDLYLTLDGQVVTDPETGRPAYDPLNKWNSGPVAVRCGDAAQFAGGVMHLTSTPNTLQTELGLAGASTVQFQSGNTDAQALICCGSFGQAYRNSDPHIGQSVNQLVGGEVTGANVLVCLADPVGLYIQSPSNPQQFQFATTIDPAKLPTGAKASDVWQVVRGQASVTDPVTGQAFPGQMILHVACQIPEAWLAAYPAMTLADIVVAGEPLRYAGQVARQFDIGLYARPLPTQQQPATAPCAGTTPTPGQPLQCMYAALWEGYYGNTELAPTGQTMSLASNTVFLAPQLAADGSPQSLTLTCNPASGTPTVQFLLPDGSAPDPAIAVAVTESASVTYAVPGNSYPGTYVALTLAVKVAPGAAAGLRGVTVTSGGVSPLTLPAAIYVQPGA